MNTFLFENIIFINLREKTYIFEFVISFVNFFKYTINYIMKLIKNEILCFPGKFYLCPVESPIIV